MTRSEDDLVEVDRLLREQRWDDALEALRALRAIDVGQLLDAVRYAAPGVDRARNAGRLDVAIALQELIVEAYVAWASWSTSGGEGRMRTAELERERALLAKLRSTR